MARTAEKKRKREKRKRAPQKKGVVHRQPGDVRNECLFLDADDELDVQLEEWTDPKTGRTGRANILMHQQRYEMAIDYIKPGEHVLDLGCGSGYGVAMMTCAGAEQVLGLDNKEKHLKYAMKHYAVPRANFKGHDISKRLPFATGSVDVVTCFDAIEHIEEGEFLMREVSRVLRPGGRTLISTPLKIPTEEKTRNEYHVREYSAMEFMTMLNSNFDEVGVYLHAEEGFYKWDGRDGIMVMAVAHKRDQANPQHNEVFKKAMLDSRIRSGELRTPGTLLTMDEDMEYLVTYNDVISVPLPDGRMDHNPSEFMVRDLTKEATVENTKSMESGGNVYWNKEPVWRNHFNRNRKKAKAGRWHRDETTPEQQDVVYIVGTSPNLDKNGHLLSKINNGIRIGLNGAAALVGPQNLDLLVTLETENSTQQCWWWHEEDGTPRDFKGLDLLCPVTANPKLTDYNFDNIRWFIHSGSNALYDEIRNEFEGTLLLDAGFGVSYSALDYAAMMKPKAIVLVGHDCSFPNNRMHAEGERPQEANRYVDNVFEVELDGEKHITSGAYEQIGRNLKYVSWFFRRAGIRFINATEGGIVYGPVPGVEGEVERKTLEEVLKEFNK